MYWPLGAPKVYAAARRRRKLSKDGSDSEEDEQNAESPSEAILGLRVARNGHLFATITTATLNVWHASVRMISLVLSVSD